LCETGQAAHAIFSINKRVALKRPNYIHQHTEPLDELDKKPVSIAFKLILLLNNPAA